jgi:hypothetical protein
MIEYYSTLITVQQDTIQLQIQIITYKRDQYKENYRLPRGVKNQFSTINITSIINNTEAQRHHSNNIMYMHVIPFHSHSLPTITVQCIQQ